jgi:hypothetical protein
VTLDRSIGPRCNIGPAEIARRRLFAYLSTAATIMIAAGLVWLAPPPARLLLWPVAAGAAVAWLQVTRRFCVAFGALGVENFGRLGSEARVDPSVREADRRQAVRTIIEAALIGLVPTLALVALPIGPLR